MRPLSILHTESSLGWGGQEIRVLTEMEGMARRGHRVHLLTAASAEILPAARARGLSVDGLPIEAKKMPGLGSVRRWLAERGAAFDVINTHSSTDAWLVALARSTLKDMPPVLRTRHVSTRVNNSPTTRWLYQRATSELVVTGEALKLQLVRDNGYDPERITSVRTGIDLSRFRPLDRDDARVRLRADARPVAIVATLRIGRADDFSTRGQRCASVYRAGSCSSSARSRAAASAPVAAMGLVNDCASPARTMCRVVRVRRYRHVALQHEGVPQEADTGGGVDCPPWPHRSARFPKRSSTGRPDFWSRRANRRRWRPRSNA